MVNKAAENKYHTVISVTVMVKDAGSANTDSNRQPKRLSYCSASGMPMP